jgi:RNase P subunit RPR2
MEPISTQLPTGRWIYSTNSTNSTGHWFFIGEPVNTPVNNRNQQPQGNLTTSTQTENQNLLQNITTEELIDELMNRSPVEQKKLILESLGVCLSETTINKTESQKATTTTHSKTNIKDLPTEKFTPDTEEPPSPDEDSNPPEEYTLESISQAVDKKLRTYSPIIPATPPKGINEPINYLPTIQIDPPQHDPERKKSKSKNKIPKYDPTHPRMDKRYSVAESTEGKTYICNTCYRTFANKGSFTRHHSSCHAETVYECQECGLNTTRKDSMKHHYMRKHPNTPYHEETQIPITPPKNPKFNVRRKHTVKELNLPGDISPTLLNKLQRTIKQHKDQ